MALQILGMTGVLGRERFSPRNFGCAGVELPEHILKMGFFPYYPPKMPAEI
jgi:hypothetical protein